MSLLSKSRMISQRVRWVPGRIGSRDLLHEQQSTEQTLRRVNHFRFPLSLSRSKEGEILCSIPLALTASFTGHYSRTRTACIPPTQAHGLEARVSVLIVVNGDIVRAVALNQSSVRRGRRVGFFGFPLTCGCGMSESRVRIHAAAVSD